MTVRDKPVMDGNTTLAGGEAENAVHFYRREVDARPRPAGSFLGAFVKHSNVPAFFCQSHDPADFDDFIRRVAKADDKARECQYVAPADRKYYQYAPVLRLSGPEIGPLMWRRRTLGQQNYSIVGEIENLGHAATHAALLDLLVAPAQHWDAIVYPSQTIKVAAEKLFAMQSEYLTLRMGANASFGGVGFIVPPGINASAYQASDENIDVRDGIRRRLGIRDEDFCVLTTGKFAFYQRAHPTPLYLALESAARRTGARIHLIQAGWFDNDKLERTYRDAVKEFAPAINAIFLDGREPDIRDRVWFAADAFAAFDDAIVHGVDTEMLEAMAAGLPVVAADWGANRDIISNGENGFLVPTWLPLAESGGDLTLAPENTVMGADAARADMFLAGTVSQMTAIDVRAAAEAFEVLAGDVEHRKKMSTNASRVAAESYDWPVIVRRHQALWSELRQIRSDAAEIAPAIAGRPAVPHMGDPFTVFAPFAGHQIAEQTMVKLSPGLSAGEGLVARLGRIRSNPINDTAGHSLLEPEEQEHVLKHLSERNGVEVIKIAELLPENRRFLIPRTLAWLAKMGVVQLSGSEPDDVSSNATERGVSLIELGVNARRQGADAAASEYFKNALAQDPNDPVANQHMGELMAEAHEMDKAIMFFKGAITANPSAVEARLDLGKALFLKGEQKEGIAYLQEAVQLAPENGDAHYLLGAAYRRIGMADEAVKSLERSLRAKPKNVASLVHLAYARKSAGRRAEAIQSFRDALRWEPDNLYAQAGEMSLSVERDGQKLLERDQGARRVALHFNSAQQFRPFRELFNAMLGVHWPLLTSDGRDLEEFQPDVVVVGGAQTRLVRDMVPNAIVVSAPMFLASQNRFQVSFDGADAICAPGPLVADAWARLGFAEETRIHVTGHLPLDGLFRGDVLETPRGLEDVSACVLYAPGASAEMSSVELLGDNIDTLIRGDRRDVTLVIKPHPDAFSEHPAWIETLRRSASENSGVILVDDPNADIRPYLQAADVLVSDVSSVIFDYLAIDRPILLVRNEQAASDPQRYDPQGIEWRWREVGREILSVESLARAVDLALKTPDAGTEVRARYRQALFGDTVDGAITDRIVELISELST